MENKQIPEISIIIPVYKDPQWIKDTLNSLINQDFSKNKYEIIVVNDWWDIETENEIKRFENIKYINIMPNKWSYNARNEWIRMSQWDLMAFIDCDIKANKDWLKLWYNLLQKYDYVWWSVKIDTTKIEDLSHWYEYLTAFDNKRNLQKLNFIPTANLFVRREVIDKVWLFNPELWSWWDVEFWNRVYRSNTYAMYYSRDLFVVHPPRWRKKLEEKYIRVLNGTIARINPNWIKRPIFFIRKIIVALINPCIRVLLSRRKIKLISKIKVFFWSIWHGIINSKNWIKLIFKQ
jgi:glycosyltransferase involved in cell wall biosynthesis